MNEDVARYVKGRADEVRALYKDGRKCVAVLRHVNGTVCFFDGSTPEAVFEAALAVLRWVHAGRRGSHYQLLDKEVESPALGKEFVDAMPDSLAKRCALAELEAYERDLGLRGALLADRARIEEALAGGDGEHAFAILDDFVGVSLVGHGAAFWVGQLEDLSRWSPQTKF